MPAKRKSSIVHVSAMQINRMTHEICDSGLKIQSATSGLTLFYRSRLRLTRLLVHLLGNASLSSSLPSIIVIIINRMPRYAARPGRI
jgi:hypothetical protein